MIDPLVKIALAIGGGLALVILGGLYVMFFPEKAEKIVGWFATGIARVWRKADKTAVAMKVQGQVNTLRAGWHRDSPEMIDRKLKINWVNAERAEAVVRGGDVIVFMKDSRRPEENLATAVMAYLPKALISRARRYVEPDTMRAIDLTVAKILLAGDDSTEGALDVFYERHLDPARHGSERLRDKIAEIDLIDLHGWLSRILLAEYRRVGDQLHPAEPDEACIAEAEKLADWLHKLAARGKDDFLSSLTFSGTFFKVAIIFVADRNVLANKGVEPYRKRAKRHIYKDKFDAVYLLARDPNLYAVDELAEALKGDAMVASKTRHSYRLRRDFEARMRIRRERAICVCLRRRQAGEDDVTEESEEDAALLPIEEYEATQPAATHADGEALTGPP